MSFNLSHMKHSIPILLALIVFTVLVVSCSMKQDDSTKERPNILYIMSDDHAYQAISVCGYGLNKTPNIDRLAEEGAIFYPCHQLPCRTGEGYDG